MKKVIMLMGQLLTLLILLSCSTHTQFDKVLAPGKENTQSNKQQASDKTQEAELNGFSLDRQDTVLLELSNTINIEKQVVVKLLSPDDSTTIIYIGIGQEKRNATVKNVGNNIEIQIE